jgi:hypothetical protein
MLYSYPAADYAYYIIPGGARIPPFRNLVYYIVVELILTWIVEKIGSEETLRIPYLTPNQVPREF